MRRRQRLRSQKIGRNPGDCLLHLGGSTGSERQQPVTCRERPVEGDGGLGQAASSALILCLGGLSPGTSKLQVSQGVSFVKAG